MSWANRKTEKQISITAAEGFPSVFSETEKIRISPDGNIRIFYGGDKETRTLGPLRARQVLSQLSYTPIWWTFRDSNPGPTGYEPVALTN